MLASTLDIYVHDENELIPTQAIRQFKLHSSIFSQYPTGTLILADPDGRLLSQFSIRPGSIIRIVATDMSQLTGEKATPNAQTPKTTFSLMVVVGLENNDHEEHPDIGELANSQTGPLGGNVTVHLAHLWALLNNNNNHAYQKKISDIIKSVAEDNSRGFAFAKVNIPPSGTDDTGGVIRYKLQESEPDFIVNKLLPYATIGRQAAYAFVNELNVFALQSFKTMYDKTPLAVIIPPMEDTKTQSSIMMDESKVPGKRHSFIEGSWFVGRKFREQMPVLKKIIYVENPIDKVIFKALSNHHSSIPGYTLIKKGFVASIGASDSVAYQNRPFEDALRLNINIAGIMNEFFEVTVTVPLIVDVAAVGDPVHLFLMNPDASTPHWANGKWLIVAAEHFERNAQYYSKLLLAKPSIDNLPSSLDPTKYLKD